MQIVFEIQQIDAAYEVHVVDRDGAPIADADGQPLKKALATLDAGKEEMFARILQSSLQQGDMTTFGHHLFDMLIGPSWWAHLTKAGGAIEIVVDCDRHPLFARLPWEMMHVGPTAARFLAEEPQVGLVRRISGSEARFRPIASPPKVLLCIGSELSKDVIRPGAECLALLHGLRPSAGPAARPIRLRTHLLMRASPKRFAEAVREFQPDVVHLICHGDVDTNSRRGYLDLVSDEDEQKRTHAFSETLIAALGVDPEKRPPIVVLSACYTADGARTAGKAARNADVGQVAIPLAREIGMHVPVVVGMSGAITDQACRLFARQFYESLLVDGDVAQAAAMGRRAALISGGTDPRTTVDWTMPIVWCSPTLTSTKLPIEAVPAETIKWGHIAEGIAGRPNEVVFCDRVEVMNQFDMLMAGANAQRSLRREGTDLQVLLVRATVDENRKYGLTYLLKELKAKAVTSGHVPVMLTFLANQWPKRSEKLLDVMTEQCRKIANLFGVTGAVCPNLNVLLRSKGPDLPDAIDPSIHEAFPRAQQWRPLAPQVLALALRLDLQQLIAAIRPKIPADQREHSRIVLLIDDVHQMDEAALELTSALLDADGTRGGGDDIRAVLTYMESERPAGNKSALDALKTFQNNTWVDVVTVGRFGEPDEKRHAYERFLLHWCEGDYHGLVVKPEDPVWVAWVWQEFDLAIDGVPSLLPTEGSKFVKRCLRLPEQVQVLRRANDDDALKAAAAHKR